MPFTDDEKVLIAEITYETFGKINGLVGSLNTAQEDAITDDLTTWGLIRDSHVKLAGGSDGVDFDNERKRQAIRMRIRKMLGLPLWSSEIRSLGGAFAGGISKADMDARKTNSDNPSNAFTVGLHVNQ